MGIKLKDYFKSVDDVLTVEEFLNIFEKSGHTLKEEYKGMSKEDLLKLIEKGGEGK